MVKIYNAAENVRLSEHFTSGEFSCKCGKPHDTQIDSALTLKLEELRAALGCSKIIVSSGYRCPAHDRSVGGNGSGQHTKGSAADIICYGKDGKIISSRIVSCAAQDIGFSGIANIDSTYTATHVDVRTASKWLGDETVITAHSVTSDFYRFYNLSRSDVYPDAPKPAKSVTLTIDGVTYSGTLTEE